MKYERMKLRHILFAMDPKYKKKAEFKDDDSDIDEDFIVEHEEAMKTKEIEKAEAKFAKDNEKLVEEGKEPHEKSVLKARIKNIEAEFERLADERGTKNAENKRFKTTDAVIEAYKKLTDKVKAFELQMVDKDAGKEVALGTRSGLLI
jgi:DNA topoisomerase-1